MAPVRTDEERIARLIERVRLLIAVTDDIPIQTKLDTQSLLKMFEAAMAEVNSPSDEGRAAGYFQALYRDLQPYPDIEALLSAMRVFAPYL
jgi:hypothetical protein